MKTTIEYKQSNDDGLVTEVYDDVAPSLNIDDQTLDIIDKDSNVVGGDVSLALIERVIFEP